MQKTIDLQHISSTEAAHAIHRSRARDATDLRNAYFPSLSTRTVELHLSNMGLPGRVRREKPWLSEKHVAERYQWAKDHLSCTEADWRRVVFSDESPFHLFPIRGREWCRRGPGEEFLAQNLAPRLKHGGDGIQVWGCMTASGVGRLHLVQDHMDKFQYTAIIDDGLHDTLSDHHLTPSSIQFGMGQRVTWSNGSLDTNPALPQQPAYQSVSFKVHAKGLYVKRVWRLF
jgi:hypothetical protein